MVKMYDLLREQNAWYSEYRHPPEVVCRRATVSRVTGPGNNVACL